MGNAWHLCIDCRRIGLLRDFLLFARKLPLKEPQFPRSDGWFQL